MQGERAGVKGVSGDSTLVPRLVSFFSSLVRICRKTGQNGVRGLLAVGKLVAAGRAEKEKKKKRLRRAYVDPCASQKYKRHAYR